MCFCQIGKQDLGGVIDNSGIDPTKFSQLTQSLRADLNLSTCCRRTGWHRLAPIDGTCDPPAPSAGLGTRIRCHCGGWKESPFPRTGWNPNMSSPTHEPPFVSSNHLRPEDPLGSRSLVCSFQTIDTKRAGVFASYLRWCWRSIS